ncbi:hypothetical protein ACHAXS_009146 [Conticribra weissflogii]
MEQLPSSAIDDVFARINANLQKQGQFHVGKCHGKTVSTASTNCARTSGSGSARFRKKRAAKDDSIKTTLFRSQLPATTPSKNESGHLHAPLKSTWETIGRSPLAGESIHGSDSRVESETDSKPPGHVSPCANQGADSRSSSRTTTPPTHSSPSAPEPSFRPLAWEAPTLFGPHLSSFVGSVSRGGGQKRTRDEEPRDDDYSNTATAKIAAAAARESCMELFPYSFGLRYTREEADDLVSFADRFIPTNSKRAKKSS